MTDLYAPVIPRLMDRLAAIQIGEREHAKPTERRLETELAAGRGRHGSDPSRSNEGGSGHAVADAARK